MRRSPIALVVFALVLLHGPVAHAQAPTTTPPPPPLPKAWILVDADSGAVIDGSDVHTPLPAASVFKLFTALLTVEHVPPGSDVPVSARAEGMPARKINLKAGQQWRAEDLLRALLLVSANDAAVALAEQVGGSEAGFATLLDETADRLGMEDHPVLRDPAGLDDEFSYEGGNLISARDLAILARAALAYPEIASIVTLPDYRFDGGDGNPHRLLNHNRLLKTYPGAIGLKTGYTRRAGHCFIAAARRDGRTMIAVVLNAVDTYGSATALLDRGFATPVAALADMDHLPEVALAPEPDASTPTAVPGEGELATPAGKIHAAPVPAAGGRAGLPLVSEVALLMAGGVPAVWILGRRRRRRPRRHAAA